MSPEGHHSAFPELSSEGKGMEIHLEIFPASFTVVNSCGSGPDSTLSLNRTLESDQHRQGQP